MTSLSNFFVPFLFKLTSVPSDSEIITGSGTVEGDNLIIPQTNMEIAQPRIPTLHTADSLIKSKVVDFENDYIATDESTKDFKHNSARKPNLTNYQFKKMFNDIKKCSKKECSRSVNKFKTQLEATSNDSIYISSSSNNSVEQLKLLEEQKNIFYHQSIKPILPNIRDKVRLIKQYKKSKEFSSKALKKKHSFILQQKDTSRLTGLDLDDKYGGNINKHMRFVDRENYLDLHSNRVGHSKRIPKYNSCSPRKGVMRGSFMNVSRNEKRYK